MSLPTLVTNTTLLYDTNVFYQHEEAEAYLFSVKLRWQAAGVPMRGQVLSGTPPEMIVAFAKEQGIDLIAMSTRGRSGFSRLIYGSVAEAVLRGARLPVLLIPINS